MRLLMLGGSWFLGRRLATDALARGWRVTAFTRGRSGSLPDGVEHIRGDRTVAEDLVHLDAWYAVGRNTRRAEGVVYNYMHQPEGFPNDSEIDLETVRSLGKAFFASGGDRPTGVRWKPWPHDQI